MLALLIVFGIMTALGLCSYGIVEIIELYNNYKCFHEDDGIRLSLKSSLTSIE